jgi:hypothetical protein
MHSARGSDRILVLVWGNLGQHDTSAVSQKQRLCGISWVVEAPFTKGAADPQMRVAKSSRAIGIAAVSVVCRAWRMASRAFLDSCLGWLAIQIRT